MVITLINILLPQMILMRQYFTEAESRMPFDQREDEFSAVSVLPRYGAPVMIQAVT